MKRRHFSVLTLLANGHVYPTLRLCAELVKRGHRVTYATNEHYAGLIEEVGAEPVLFKSKSISEELVKQIKIGMSLPLDDPRTGEMMKAMRSHLFTDATELLSQVDTFYRQNAPDLILYDHEQIAGRILAKSLDIPPVRISGHFAYYNNFAFRKSDVCENPECFIACSKEQDSFLSKYGITSPGSLWHVENLNIHFIPKEFQYHSDWFDERFCFSGALLDRPYKPVWTNTSSGQQIILISGASLLHGTEMDCGEYFGMFVEALSGMPYHCILSIGDAEFSRKLPSNFELNRHASHLEILPHAALSICHGGMSTTLEAIYNGVPVLMIPLTNGCEEVAYRAAELGLGVTIPRAALSIKDIRSKVSEMLHDPMLQNRVSNAQGIFKNSGGKTLAANRIEHYLADRGVV